MKVDKGRYFLVSEDVCDSSKRVFDFSSDAMDFVDQSDEVNGVSVATIDSLTSAFQSPCNLESYLEKGTCFDREDPNGIYYISYKGKFNQGEKKLSTVWDDEVLHEIASNAKGGKINYYNETTREVLANMLSELKSRGSRFGADLLVSTNSDICLNDYNKSLIQKCAFSSSSYDQNLDIKLRASFASYREYRALYLAYLKHLKKYNKDKPMVLVKK